MHGNYAFPLAKLLPIAALVLLGCGNPSEEHRRGSVDHVLLITIDTARWDHFSYTGSSLASTPNIDDLAKSGLVFETAIAPTPITLPSHATILTGLIPPKHGVRNNGEFHLNREFHTLAEILSERGFSTAAFIASPALDRQYGLDQGFGHYDDDLRMDVTLDQMVSRRRGEEIAQLAISWLRSLPSSERTFVWVHIFDPHAPYDTPVPSELIGTISRYAAGVMRADAAVGQLLDYYKQSKRFENTLVVLTADHGESLGEHQEKTHGVFVYDSTIRVPLILAGPGIPKKTESRFPAALVDVLPTIVQLTGSRVEGDIDGLSLVEPPSISGMDFRNRKIYLETKYPEFTYGWHDFSGLRSSRRKYIAGTFDELYDLDSDPEESENIAAANSEQVRTFKRTLEAMLRLETTRDSRHVPSAAAQKQLEALGYSPSSDSVSETSSTRIDPHEGIVGTQRVSEAVSLFENGQTAKGISVLQEIVDSEPENFPAHERLGVLLLKAKQYRRARAVLLDALALKPNHQGVRTNLGYCYLEQGETERAREMFAGVVSESPNHLNALYGLALSNERLGNREESIANWKSYISQNQDQQWVKKARFHLERLLDDAP